MKISTPRLCLHYIRRSSSMSNFPTHKVYVSIKYDFPQQGISIEIIRKRFIVSLEVAHIYI